MYVKYTNFEGDWDAPCAFCGKPNRKHQVDNGEYEGIRYIHRQPCKEEQYHTDKAAVKRVFIIRLIVNTYNFLAYLWGKIPLKEEIKLVSTFLKDVLSTIRGLYHLIRNKPT